MKSTRRWLTLGAVLTTTALVTIRADEPDLARELPRIKSMTPAEAMATFQIHKGFQIRPIAVEPVVTDPVSLVYDADGRIYVVEMRGYPYPEKQPSGNVSLLTDRDGDGTFETRTIFLDGLSWPTGVVAYDGGVFIAVAPDILYAKDTDGDGVADVRRKVFTGFGTQNVQALLNGLIWGPDGWIYGAAGSNGGDIKVVDRPDAPAVSLRGRDFRFRPDGSAFEAISGGGQFGQGFDDWGHRFVCNNSNHIRQIVLPSNELERNPALSTARVLLDIPVEGGAGPVYRISPAEPWRIVRTRQRAADPVMVKRLPMTELHATGFFTSATGVTIYRGTAFPPEYRGNAFIGDVGGNLVHRKIVERAGTTFKATRADAGVEFLASPDNWFRPVNFANTPDGTLLVLDMYRETIEHPESIPEPIKRHLDLTSGKDLGRLYEIVPDGFKRRPRPLLSKAKTEALVATLADPDAWWRETAQRLLIERRDASAIAGLVRLARDRPTALARVHALWTLDSLGALEPGPVKDALADAEPNVREQAARLAEARLKADPALTTALIARANDPDAMVRMQVAFALGAATGPEAIAALATIAQLSPTDYWTRQAVLSSVNGRADALLDALAGTADDGGFLLTPAGLGWLDELTYLVGAENRKEQVGAVLARFLRPGASPVIGRGVVRGLGRGLRRSGGSIRAAAGSASLQPFFDGAATIARGSGPLPDRLGAIELLGLAPTSQAIDVLPELLDARQPTPVQLAALQTLNLIADPKIGKLLVDRWPSLSPSVRGEALEALLARKERVDALLAAIEAKAIGANEIDSSRRATLDKYPDPAVRSRAAKALGAVVRGDRAKVIEGFRPSLAIAGDPDRGKAVFKQACATCHRASGIGIEVGPNLATVTHRSPEDLLVHILDPNREVPANYVNYAASLADGRVVTGLIVNESAHSLTLKRAEGVTEVVPRDRIEQIVSSAQSLMPEGLEKGLAPRDFADLIAFLKALPPETVAPPAR